MHEGPVDSFSLEGLLPERPAPVPEAPHPLGNRDLLAFIQLGQNCASTIHDLNNSLMVVMGYLGLLQHSSSLTQEQQKDLSTIYEILSDCRRMTDRTLGMIHGEGMRFERVSILEILDRVIGKTGQRAEIRSKGIRIEREYDVRAAALEADAFQLERAISNLMNNALNAICESGKGDSLQVSTVSLADKIQIGIRDNGPGIPTEILPLMGQPFFTSRRSRGGSGLGLLIVDQIVKSHGGRLEFYNHPQGGAVFLVTLPLLEGKQEEPLQTEL